MELFFQPEDFIDDFESSSLDTSMEVEESNRNSNYDLEKPQLASPSTLLPLSRVVHEVKRKRIEEKPEVMLVSPFRNGLTAS